jgi:hypothetical protein
MGSADLIYCKALFHTPKKQKWFSSLNFRNLHYGSLNEYNALERQTQKLD